MGESASVFAGSCCQTTVRAFPRKRNRHREHLSEVGEGPGGTRDVSEGFERLHGDLTEETFGWPSSCVRLSPALDQWQFQLQFARL